MKNGYRVIMYKIYSTGNVTAFINTTNGQDELRCLDKKWEEEKITLPCVCLGSYEDVLEQTRIGCNVNVRDRSMRIVWTIRTLVLMELCCVNFIISFCIFPILFCVLKQWYKIYMVRKLNFIYSTTN